MGPNLNRELLLLILQFLDEESLRETAHKLEQESGCYFNMEYFESQVLAGEWDTVECYLSGFTKVQENDISMETFFEIRKLKYLEALDMKDYAKAVDILRKDLIVFEPVNNGIYKQLTQLIPLKNIREHEKLSGHGDTTSERKLMFLKLRKLIGKNPQIRNKLEFPHLQTSRLRNLINQSLNWQHQLCKDRTSNPDIKTLFVDHTCLPIGGSQPRTNYSIVGAISQGMSFLPIPTHAPFPHGVNLSGNSSLPLTRWVANSEPSMPHPPVVAGTGNLFPPRNAGLLKRTRTPPVNNTGIDYQFVNPEHVKRSCIGPYDEINADSNWPTDVKQSLRDEDANKIKNLNLAGVSYSTHCRSLKLPDSKPEGKIVQLLYTNKGSIVLALDSNAVHKRWTWTRNEGNPTGKATTTDPTPFLESTSQSTTHRSGYKDPAKQISCMVLSKNDTFVLSTSGGDVSLLKLNTLQHESTLLNPSPAATTFALHPNDNNIVAFGLENSKILIRQVNIPSAEGKMLQGPHQKKITGLAFSLSLKLLISAGADGLLCAWSLDGWGLQRQRIVYPQGERLSSLVGVSKIQFHKDQVHLLVVQESQIAIYDASRFERTCHWEPQDSMAAPISSATYSCDSQLIYASFCDGAVGVFDADVLRLLFRVLPSEFLPSDISSENIYPLAIAAHPHEHNQFAIGLTDGAVYLIELEIWNFLKTSLVMQRYSKDN